MHTDFRDIPNDTNRGSTCELSLVLLIYLVAGCATPSTQASLTIQSEPEGAYISVVDADDVFGISPVTVVYDSSSLEKQLRSDGCYYGGGIEALWVSGAIASVNPIRFCRGSNYSYELTLERPDTHVNLDRDRAFASKIQNLQLKQSLSSADSATSDLVSAFLKALRESQPANCESQVIDGVIRTACL